MEWRTRTRAHADACARAHTAHTAVYTGHGPIVSFLFAPVLFSLVAPKASGWCLGGIPLLRVPLVRCGPDGVLAASRLFLVVQMLSLSCPNAVPLVLCSALWCRVRRCCCSSFLFQRCCLRKICFGAKLEVERRYVTLWVFWSPLTPSFSRLPRPSTASAKSSFVQTGC